VNNIHDLLRLTEEGDPTAITAVTRQATHLGRGLRLVTAALAPEVVLITGDLTTSWARFGPIIQKEMESTMLAGTPPALGITKDGELSRLRGAAAVVLQRHSGYHTSTHLAASGKRSRRSASATK
jgi:predicted NBD/HSP70 family sugar kinase